jgi:hypothetical protein
MPETEIYAAMSGTWRPPRLKSRMANLPAGSHGKCDTQKSVL